MKKILIVHNFYRNYGGEDSNIYEEIKFLNRDFDVKFFQAKNDVNLSFFAILSLITRSNFKINKEFTNILEEFEPDLVYVHNTWFNINLGIFKILSKRKVSTVLKIHNFRYDCSRYFFAKDHLKGKKMCGACGFEYKKRLLLNKYFESSYIKSLFLYFYSLKYFKILKNFKLKIIAVNNFHKLQLIKLGIPQNKITVINNPLNLDIKKVNTKENNIVYAGRISREKGLIELLEAWKDADIKDYNLLIIGDGELQKQLKQKYSASNVKFLGFLPNEKVLEHISKSTAVVTATKLYEGHPRLLSEASALGALSIYPSFGGMDEFFPENYEFAFEQYNYNDLKNKFILLTDKELRKNSINKVTVYTQKLLNENIIRNKFIKVFEEHF
jgi:glycosyltransferase involved in cell wall biosynthesis